MVGPNGLEPSTSSVSRKRSNQTELRACTTSELQKVAVKCCDDKVYSTRLLRFRQTDFVDSGANLVPQ
jgi:hypothetical protein